MTTWRLSGALVALQAEVEAAHPGRSKISDGTKGDAAHAARVSDHNPDPAGIVHAWDCTVWDDNDTDFIDDVAGPLAAFLLERRDPRTKYVIHRGQMFASYATATRPAWTWGPYSGPNGHFHHVHVSVYGDDPAPWGYPTTDQELTMDTEVKDRFDKLEAKLDRLIASDRTSARRVAETVRAVRRLIASDRTNTARVAETVRAVRKLLGGR